MQLNRVSIIDQTANAVRKSILDGEWQGMLPGERSLCKDLRVGRNTLRAALKRMEAERLVKIIPGQGTQIVSNSPKLRPKQKLAVGLLSPRPIEFLFPRQILWIDALRDQLAKDGYLLKSFHGQQYFQGNPGKAMQRLIDQEKCGCWILVSSSEVIQKWFSENKIACLIAGSCHKGIDLPFVDVDYRALCRHAVTTFLRHGHKNVVYLAPPPQLAGDIQSEKGWIEGLDGYTGDKSCKGDVIHLELSVDRIVSVIKRLTKRKSRPTAILVHDAFQYLTVFSTLTQLRLRIPQDISLICRESENFLPYMEPTPARYVHNSNQFASKMSRIVGNLMNNSPIQTKSNLLVPDLVDGGSVSKPHVT